MQTLTSQLGRGLFVLSCMGFAEPQVGKPDEPTLFLQKLDSLIVGTDSPVMSGYYVYFSDGCV